MVFFTKCRKLESFFAPKLFDQKLILKNQVKYLGVILEIKMNWKFQIDNKIRKDVIANWQCHKGNRKNMGAEPEDHWIYTSVKRPLLTK
jgi:hypothetical protein